LKSEQKILGIRADWKAVCFCIIAASTFWFFNAMNHDYTVNIFYPIEIVYDDSRVVSLTEPPKKVKINVTGYGWKILRKYLGFKTEPIIYKPDNLPEREYVSSDQLSSILSRQISDIRFNYIIKDTIYFKFDYLKQKKVRILVDSSTISLANGYQITSPIIISPDSILFQGPSSFLDKIPDSMKVSISKAGIKSDVEETIKIPEHGYEKVLMLNKEVKIRFNVNKFEKQNVVIQLKTINFPHDTAGINYDKEIILTYYIKEEDKNKVSVKDFAAGLYYQDMDPTDSTIGPRLLKKPSYIKDYYFTPYAVKVSYKK
jgi:hypothetical protein